MRLFSNQKLAKYVLTGGATFIFEYSTFLLLVYVFSLKVWVAQAVSYLLALVVNFSLLRYWTFRHDHKGAVSSQAPKYVLLAIFNLPITTIIISRLSDTGIKPFLAKLIVIALVATWNYFVYDKLIFKHKPVEAA